MKHGCARASAVLLLTVAGGFAGPIYSVSVIPPPAGFPNVDMSTINDAGQVAGTGANGTFATMIRAFIGTTLESSVIPLPSEAYGNAINGAGQVAGYSFNGTADQAFIGTTSGSTVIPPPSGYIGATGYAINDAAQVAGSAFNGTTDQAFIGTTSGSSAIPLPSGYSEAFGYAINDEDQVAGYAHNGTIYRAFVGTTSGSTIIPLPSGYIGAFGFAINDAGQVAGYAYNFFTGDKAFIGTTSGSTVIPLPSGATYARPTYGSLNSSGVVVGFSDAGGWIWDPTEGTQLLNTFVPTGWNITGALSISNNGLILAQGSFDGGASQYVELSAETPTPEPAAGLFAAVGFLTLAAMGRWNLSRSR